MIQIIIEVFSSTYDHRDNMNFIPNHITTQIFELQDKFINILFLNYDDFLLNINSINGIDCFNWNEEGETHLRDIYLI